MYNLDDSSYMEQPPLMSYDVAERIIKKTCENCIENNINEFLFAFHGGEPFMHHKDFFEYFVVSAREFFPDNISLYFAVQSNGTLITKEIASICNELKIQIGISLDGTKEINDLNRLYRNGKSTFSDVLKGINNSLLFPYHKKTLGLLTVINLDSDPIDLYNLIKQIRVPRFDLLFPYFTYDTFPYSDKLSDTNYTPYADWLIKLFDRWFDDNEQPDIRMFSGFVRCFFGEEYPNDFFGNFKNGLLVIETNGEIEPIDYLKACGEEFTKTGLNILHNNLSEAYDSELINLYYNSHNILCTACELCPINNICGGANLTSRYSKENGFNNTSIYCKDVMKLISYIQNRIFTTIGLDLFKEYDLELLDYNHMINQIIQVQNLENEILSSFKHIKNE